MSKLKIIIGRKAESQTRQFEALANFLGLDAIEYVDHGKSETYTLVKGEDKFKLEVSSTMVDGGFMNVHEVEPLPDDYFDGEDEARAEYDRHLQEEAEKQGEQQ